VRGLAPALVVLLAGCGGVRSPDLFVVSREGSIPGARLELIVSDGGTLRCNGGSSRPLPDDLLLSARAVERDVQDAARRGVDLPAGPRSVLTYRLRDADGHVAFPDTAASGHPELARLAFFVRQAAQRACGLPR
jgi:hypothetical protein